MKNCPNKSYFFFESPPKEYLQASQRRYTNWQRMTRAPSRRIEGCILDCFETPKAILRIVNCSKCRARAVKLRNVASTFFEASLLASDCFSSKLSSIASIVRSGSISLVIPITYQRIPIKDAINIKIFILIWSNCAEFTTFFVFATSILFFRLLYYRLNNIVYFEFFNSSIKLLSIWFRCTKG